MKRHSRIIVILLLSMLIVCATACGGGSDVAPTPTPIPTPHPPAINYLPDGWWLVSELYYGQYIKEGEPKTGSLQYKNEDDTAMVFIKYGDLPAWASGKEYDAEGFLEESLSRECESCQKPDPDEIGTMTFCGRPAAYARFSLPEENTFGLIVISISDSVMIEGDAVWWTAGKENEVMSIIGNVSY